MQSLDIDRPTIPYQTQQQTSPSDYLEYRYRWIIVALFGMCTITNVIASSVVGPIATKVANTYNVSNAAVNSIAMIFRLVYTFVNFPANYIIDLNGLRVGLIIGISLISSGLAVTLLINRSFWFLLIGSLIIAAGQPFIINCPAKIATFWFQKENRPFATSLLTAINLFGICIAAIFPTVIVKEKSTGQKAKKQIFLLLLIVFIFATVAAILIFLLMEKQPPTPASKGSETQKTPFRQGIRVVFRNHSFQQLFIGFVLFYGTMLTFSAIVNFLFKPYGFTDFQMGLNSIGQLVFGVVGSIIMSLYVKRTQEYMRAFKICTLCGVVATILTNIMLNIFPSVFFTILFMSLKGFVMTPILPLSYDLGCELVFPVGEALITGILNGGGMLFSFIMIGIIQLVLDMGSKSQSLKIMLVFTFMTIIGSIFYWRIKPRLKRREYEAGLTGGKYVDTPIQQQYQQQAGKEAEQWERQKRYAVFQDQHI